MISVMGVKISDQDFNGATRTFHLWMPIRTEWRARESKAVRSTRVRRERKAARWFWKTHDMWMLDGYRGALVVTMVRVSPTGVAGTVKALHAVRDQIASQLGRDDGDRTITWIYDSRKGAWGVDVFIEAPKGGVDATQSG